MVNITTTLNKTPQTKLMADQAEKTGKAAARKSRNAAAGATKVVKIRRKRRGSDLGGEGADGVEGEADGVEKHEVDGHEGRHFSPPDEDPGDQFSMEIDESVISRSTELDHRLRGDDDDDERLEEEILSSIHSETPPVVSLEDVQSRVLPLSLLVGSDCTELVFKLLRLDETEWRLILTVALSIRSKKLQADAKALKKAEAVVPSGDE